MKFSVIAATTFIASASAMAGTMANMAECAKWNDCVADNSCTAITKSGGNGMLKFACVLTTKCPMEMEFTSSTDSKKYMTTADGCLKEADSSIRNAISMAVAAMAVAYAL